MVPYKWQRECVEQWFAHGCRGIVEVITGAGKTHMAMLAMRALLEACGTEIRTFILVPRVALASQWKDALLKVGCRQSDVSILAGGRPFREDCPICIGVINSARYRFARMIADLNAAGASVLLIADEYHHYASGENSKVFDFLKSPTFDESRYFALGLSATADLKPYKADLSRLIGPMVYSYSIDDGLEEGIINPFDIFSISIQLDGEKQEEYWSLTHSIELATARLRKLVPSVMKRKDLPFESLLDMMRRHSSQKVKELADRLFDLLLRRRALIINADGRISAASRIIEHLPKHRRIMVFSERIEQAEALRCLLDSSFPGHCGIYHSKLDRQMCRRMLDSFRCGDIRILIACKALDEGIDVPDADVGIFMSNTESQRQRIQRAGRLLRRSEGKLRSCLYYIYVAGTVESPHFLNVSSKDVNEILGRYDEKGGFLIESLSDAVHSMLAKVADKATASQLVEIDRALASGCLVNDFLQDESYIQRMIETDGRPSYWRTMKELGRQWRNLEAGRFEDVTSETSAMLSDT